jgi:choline kinase
LGEAVGINYIALQDRQTLTTHLARCSAQDYFEAGLEAAIADGLRVTPVDVTGCLAVEVDFAEDLERANEEVGRTVTSAA